MSDELPKAGTPIEDQLPTIIRMLRKPAGDDPRFASLEAIAANRKAFNEKVHSTWKQLHSRSLDEILTVEEVLLSFSGKKLPPAFEWYLRQSVNLWRRINDAIVWALVGQRDHVIRTVCHRKDRQRLTDANPVAIRKFLDKVNADPQSIAIWSDATSCVDLGDVLCHSFSGGLNGFLEVKSGSMNDKIFDLMDVKGTQQEVVKAITNFADEHGPKAVKQLERVVRQRQRYNHVMDIIEYDHGFDPRQDAQVTVTDTSTQLKTYDEELQQTINAAQHEPVLQCIDRCLWVYVDKNSSKDPKDKIAAFQQAVAATSPTTLQWFREQFGSQEPFSPVLLEENIACPEAIPLFLRQLEPETIRDVLIGKLMFSVFLFVDWYELGCIVADLGADLVWSSRKYGRSVRSKPKAQRSLSLGDRVPRVQLNKRYLEGFSKIYRVLFEGITPTSIAAQYIEVLKSIECQRLGNSE